MEQALFAKTGEYKRLLAGADTPGTAALFGLPPAGRAQMLAALARDTGRPLCVVTPGEAEATRFAADLNTLGIAASMASGVRENFGTSTKSVHIGKTAGDGVLAAQMASHGITSSPSALEGHEGYLREYAGFDGVTFGDDFARTLGAPYDLCSPGFAIKLYPSCSSTHRAIDALTELIRENELKPADIAKIEIGLSQSALLPMCAACWVIPVPTRATLSA